MESLKTIGAIVALATNVPLFYGIYKNTILGQNFSTWILWSVLDVITTAALMLQHGNYKLSGVYVISSLSISMLLFIKKQIAWELVDTLTVAGVMVCLVIWYFMGNEAATIASTSAVVISSFPLMKTTYYHPEQGPTKIYIFFCISSLLSLIAGKDWSIKETLYPEATLGISIIFVLLSLRKPKEKKLPRPCTYDIIVG